MKMLNAAAVVLVLFFASCTKNEIIPKDLKNAYAHSGSNSLQLVSTQKLILQPGADGNDLWFKYWINHPYYADTCDTDIRLIKGLTWTVQKTKLITRSVIKFDSLVKIPSNAEVVSATLYLYGPSPNSPDVHKHLPMGNSSYPGSVHAENSCFILRITSPWDKHTICWNNQPTTASEGQAILTPSTQQWNYNVVADVTNLVKPIVTDPSKNYGFMLKLQNENASRSMGFFSSEYHEAAKRPKLVVEYR